METNNENFIELSNNKGTIECNDNVNKNKVDNEKALNNSSSDSEISDIINEDILDNDDHLLINKNICPPLNENVISELNEIFNKIKCRNKEDGKKMSVGVIKFKNDGKDYIHCPIKHVRNKGKDVCFGVCTHSISLLDNAINRRKLSAHKFSYHFYGQAPDPNNVNVYLKTSLSIEEAIIKMKKEEVKKNIPKIIKGFQCIHCLKMNPLIKRRSKKLL
jgi:hypothetical protein